MIEKAVGEGAGASRGRFPHRTILLRSCDDHYPDLFLRLLAEFRVHDARVGGQGGLDLGGVIVGQHLELSCLEAAERVAARRLAAHKERAEAGYARATEKIREGRAGEILDEAVALAASPEVLQEVERADDETITALPKAERHRRLATLAMQPFGCKQTRYAVTKLRTLAPAALYPTHP